MSKPRVAFLGLGIMGGGMARRILGAGFPLAVYNRNRAKADALASEGAQAAASPRDAAEGADAIVSMVADDPASRSVWLGDHGALAAAKRGALCIECSTLTVAWVRELAAAAAQRGCELIDAPVTGTKPHAANGELLFLTGGTEAAIAQARPVLAVMSRAILRVGPTGSGAMLKLVNNFLCGVQAAALAEGIAMIERAGLDLGKALEMLTAGAAGSPLVKGFSARMAAHDYLPPNFHLHLMAKDLAYAQAEGKRVGVEMTSAGAAREIFQRAIAAGHGEKDVTAVVEPMRKMSAEVTRPT